MILDTFCLKGKIAWITGGIDIALRRWTDEERPPSAPQACCGA